jgi:glycosyltransferase involved in cell wall biosynthesis
MRLVLVFSRWMSLARWDELGMFERETALYRGLGALGVKIGFLTWGGREDMEFASRLPGVSILCNRFGLPPKRYERLAALLHAPHLWRANAIKTNQASAAVIARPSARLWRKPLIARMGFMASEFAAREQGEGSVEHQRELAQEMGLFQAARAIVVTTQEMADSVLARLPSARDRLSVIPNYVDTSLFAPQPEEPVEQDVIFIGRLVRQKNIPILLEALDRTKSSARIIGDGPLSGEVAQAAARSEGRIVWTPSLPNAELPAAIARSRLFVLPSLWEGHPKTLIEAMSCAAAVIGADSPGIRGVIRHGETGLLCQPTAEALAESIAALRGQPERRDALGQAARRHILATCSLERIVESELNLLNRLTGRAP